MFILNVVVLLLHYLYETTTLTLTYGDTVKEEMITVNGKFGVLMHVSNVTSALFFQLELQLPFSYVSSNVIHRATLTHAMSCSYGDVVIDNVTTSYEELSDSVRLYKNNYIILNPFDFYYLNNNINTNTHKYNAISLSVNSLQHGNSIINHLYNSNYINNKHFHLCGGAIYFGNIDHTCIVNKHKTTLISNGNSAYWSSIMNKVDIGGNVMCVNEKGSVVYFKGNDYVISVPKKVYDVIERDVIKEFVDVKMCNVGYDVKENRKYYSCATSIREKMKRIRFGIGGYWFDMGSKELFWEDGSEIFKRFVIVENGNEKDMSFTMGTQFLKQYVVSFEYNNGDKGKDNLIHFYSEYQLTRYGGNSNSSKLKYHLIIIIICILLLMNILLLIIKLNV